ncbi:Protein of unknown function [Cotesia congregata]|uniref:Sperm microtubule inner protein 1 C-terminal domain-containing protein n=1 Tax=Cotesia congregata TaxID=51543 RepID=A0A8J2H5Z9_COTCN|nr:Protein of unknown function [Cotesia congregata]
MKWFIKNKQRLLENLSNGKNSKIVESQIKSLKDDNKLIKREEKIPKGENIDQCPSTSDKENVGIDCMRSVDPSTLKILYKKDKECRNEATKSYLRKRYELRPKDKFHMIECSNWIYGWHTNDLPAISSSTFGKKFIIYDSFYRRNSSSINRDPDLSRIPQTTNPKNFNELLNS